MPLLNQGTSVSVPVLNVLSFHVFDSIHQHALFQLLRPARAPCIPPRFGFMHAHEVHGTPRRRRRCPFDNAGGGATEARPCHSHLVIDHRGIRSAALDRGARDDVKSGRHTHQLPLGFLQLPAVLFQSALQLLEALPFLLLQDHKSRSW